MSARKETLADVQLAREGRLPVRHAPFAEHQLRVPTQDWKVFERMYPGLATPWDIEAYEEAYNRFYNSSFADPYRVRSRTAQLHANRKDKY